VFPQLECVIHFNITSVCVLHAKMEELANVAVALVNQAMEAVTAVESLDAMETYMLPTQPTFPKLMYAMFAMETEQLALDAMVSHMERPMTLAVYVEVMAVLAILSAATTLHVLTALGQKYAHGAI